MTAHLDFSQYHGLDHWPGTRHCRSLPGGTRNHLRMTWDYRRRDQLLRPLHTAVLCRIGRHDDEIWYRRDQANRRDQVLPTCKHCYRVRLPSEQEIDARPALPFDRHDD